MKTNRFFAVVVSVSLFCLLFASRASGDTIAYISWSKLSNPGLCTILWEVDVDTQAITVMGDSYPQLGMKLAVSPMDHNLYGVSTGTDAGTWEIDPTTGSITSVWGPKNCIAVGFDLEGLLYTHNGAGSSLASYDLVNQTGGTFGTQLPKTWQGILGGLAIDSPGEALTATDRKHLYRVDLSDGNFTDLGIPTGMPFTIRGMDYDDSDRLLAFFDTGIYNINTSSMTATKLMSLTAPTGFYGQGFAVADVPEPSTITLLIAGLLTGGTMLRRRRK